ncbi:tRNA lysidine(34) synthetase TilS [Puniceibacterium confluentis]|uniref:tRNA lysidine(34) synthetase TilS n=1 Tax=Puniceibacterium confluentis TaxID=1958944 RepID=UPI003564870C
MGQLLGPVFPPAVGLAVSGGGDSMAMLYLAHNWTRRWGLQLRVVTVDHGLRPEAADEAAMVADACRALGWPHETLRWHWDGQGNVQNAARQARLRLMDRWRGDLGHILMAHTRDDLAETFLMRLARGSGVEGLSAMSARRVVRLRGTESREPSGDGGGAGGAASAPGNRDSEGPRSAGFEVIRPCLGMRREELRHYLRTLRGRWVEDPSNDDGRYDRVRMRRLLVTLEAEGLGVETLAMTADRLSRAKEALTARALTVWADTGQEGRALNAATGDILFRQTGFAATELDTQMRLLAAALQYVSSTSYRPRSDAVEALLDRVLAGGAGTLQGCEVRSCGDLIQISREPAALTGQLVPISDGALWDGRWTVYGQEFKGLTLRSLGEDGWAQCPGRPDGAPRFRTARALPSIWDGDRLVACDALGVGPGGTIQLTPMAQPGSSFANFLLSH